MGCAPPFGRVARGGEREHDEWELDRTWEFLAREYHWGPDYLEDVLTDEQLLAYADAAQERLDRHAQAELDRRVEEIRVGTIFAHDQKQYGRWKSRTRNARPGQRGLTGAALEAAVMGIREQFPDQVIGGAA